MTSEGKKSGGRLPGTPNRRNANVRHIIDDNVDFNKVIAAMYKLAIGVKVLRTTDDGREVYLKPPDPQAAKLLLAYRYGIPKQEIAISATAEPITGFNILPPGVYTEIEISAEDKSKQEDKR